MTDDELMALMVKVDPMTRRIPEGIRAIALGIEAAERERCAMKLQVTRSDVQLAAGEISAEEWRMCAAVLRWMQGRIRGA